MAINFGNGYPAMNGMNGMNGNMYSQKMMGSVPLSFLNKYGCEDCFRDKPYVYEFPKPYIQIAEDSKRISFWQRIINKIMS